VGWVNSKALLDNLAAAVAELANTLISEVKARVKNAHEDNINLTEDNPAALTASRSSSCVSLPTLSTTVTSVVRGNT
jgi:hypothetical protein